jgi:hypothetical protein
MKDVHVISIIALIYSIILSIVTLIFFREYTTWAILGAAVSMFNHSLMIQVSKNFSQQKLVSHLIQRYIFYIIIIAVVYFDTKDLEDQMIMIYSYIFLLLGIFAIKIGIFIYHLPFIKKPNEGASKENGDNL